MTFSFLSTLGICEVPILPGCVFKGQSKTGCFFVSWRCSGDTLAGQPSQKVCFFFKHSFKKLLIFKLPCGGPLSAGLLWPPGALCGLLRPSVASCRFLWRVGFEEEKRNKQKKRSRRKLYIQTPDQPPQRPINVLEQ